MSDYARDINLILDYLAELTEVVEKNQERHIEDIMLLRHPVTETPSLKETLLGEIYTKIRKIYDFGTALAHRNDFNDGYNNALKDVEAIINRLMP